MVTALSNIRRRTHAEKMSGNEALAEKGGVDAVNVAAFAYDIYTAPPPPHHNGVLGSTLTAIPHHRFFELRKLKKTVQQSCKRLLFHATTILFRI